jgi:hypothetical protein
MMRQAKELKIFFRAVIDLQNSVEMTSELRAEGSEGGFFGEQRA